MRSDLIDISIIVIRETDRAWGIEDENKPGAVIWLPKSQCEISSIKKPSGVAELTCPEWLAKEKGLI